MGAFTAVDQIWYPDLTDIDQPNVWAAHIAQSISDGIGKRLAKQEIAVGLKGSVEGWTIPATNIFTTVPVTVTATYADFAQGFSVAGGIATCQTPGMYVLTASLGPRLPDTAGGNASVKAGLFKNGNPLASSEVAFTTATWCNAQASSVINCAVGDTIEMRGCIAGSPGSAHVSYGQNSYLSIAMVQAAP